MCGFDERVALKEALVEDVKVMSAGEVGLPNVSDGGGGSFVEDRSDPFLFGAC